ncbi:MAG: helix-turn-helix domain-containing protein, partial [Candidatus Kariarchaeaceae archaeon]
MSRRHLLPPGNEEYLDRLGFTDQDKRVYISILDSGLVSVGEVVQLTDLSLSEVLESVRDLVDLGLVKKAQGRMPRYYATLPFFQETVTVERDTMYALDSMITSLNMTKKEILVDKNKISTDKFPQFMEKVLDSIVEDLLTPLISDIQQLIAKIDSDKGEFPTSIQKEHNTIRTETSDVITPLKSFAELQSQKFDISIIKEGDALDQYLIDRKNQRVNTLKTAHEAISTFLKSFED